MFIKTNQVCFQQEMTLGDFENLPRRIETDKALHDTEFDIARSIKCL